MENKVGYIMGACPKCKSINVTYGKEYVDDEEVIFPGKCMDCGCSFNERYYMDYIQTDAIEEDNDPAEQNKQPQE